MGCGLSRKRKQKREEAVYYDYVSGYPFVKQHPIALRMVSMTPNTQYPQYIMPSYHGILGVETGMFYFDAPTTFDTARDQQQRRFSAQYTRFDHVRIEPHEKALCSVLVMFDYTARDPNEINIRKGQMLEVFGNPYRNWLKVRSMDEYRAVGYVPSTFVALSGSLEANPWYFGDSPRSDAERALLSDKNKNGAFLVRKCNISDASHVLSVRVFDDVKHFLIRGRPSDNEGYCVAGLQQHKTLQNLIAHHSSVLDPPIPKLNKACVKLEAPPTIGLSHRLENDWEVPRHMLRLTKKLGEGHFGHVYEALFSEVLKVAVKSLKRNEMKSEFMDEVAVMQRLLHPKIVQLHGISTSAHPFYIVTELMLHGDLLTYLRKGKGHNLPERKLIDLATQIATGMAYLEANHFVHRDLAARNVLVGKDNTCKISDFGFTKLTMGSAITEGIAKLPLKWCAPECMKDKVFSSKSDVWAFGIVLVEIIEKGMEPYPGLNTAEVYKKVRGGYIMPRSFFTDCPDRLYKIMKMCWNMKPSKRPTFFSLVSILEQFYDEKDIFELS